MPRLRVGVMYGGRSGEHEVSLRSAASIVATLDRARYEIVPIAVAKDGRWLTGPESLARLEAAQRDLGPVQEHGTEVTLPADPTRRALVPLARGPAPSRPEIALDVVFPVLHGTSGEDGTIQGLLELADVPYVGSGVLASAVGMDKALMKAVLRDAGLPVCRSLVSGPEEDAAELRRGIEASFGFPCFVKPANLGSSVGIAKVPGPEALAPALAEARSWDPKVIVEEAVDARELECGVLGNRRPEASVVGELIPSHEFYDYADKYVEQGARVVIPAPIPAETAEAVRDMALGAFRAIDAAGLARVDFFLERGTGRVLVNEINTMPGFTPISMFPKLWQASGLPYPALLDRLIELALERHAARPRRRSFTPPTPADAPARQRAGR